MTSFELHRELRGMSLEEARQDAGYPASLSTLFRRIARPGGLALDEAVQLATFVASGYKRPWTDLLDYFSREPAPSDSIYSEVELGQHWPADPRRVRGLAQLIGGCRRKEPRIIWYSRFLPFALLPFRHIGDCARRWAERLPRSSSSVGQAEARLHRLLHRQMLEQTEPKCQHTLIPIFRTEFERLVDRRPPFDKLSPADVHEAIEMLIQDWARDRWILTVLINEPQVPSELGRHFSRFHSVWLGGHRLLIRHLKFGSQRLWYTCSTNEPVNEHIDLEAMRLNGLLSWREHELNPEAVAQELNRYLL